MGAWVTHDLSAFLGDGDLYGGSNHEAWDGTRLARSGAGSFWRFALPDLTLSPTDVVDVEITFSPGDPGHSTTLSAYNLNPLDTLGPSATFDDFHPIGGGFNAAGSNVTTADDTVYVSRFGPGVYAPGSDGEVFSSFQTSFDTYVATAARPYLMFRLSGASVGITQVRTCVVDATPPDNPEDDGAFLFAPPQQAFLAPLRVHPRSDGLGTSSAPRVWPPPPSVQASNRRAGGYL